MAPSVVDLVLNNSEEGYRPTFHKTSPTGCSGCEVVPPSRLTDASADEPDAMSHHFQGQGQNLTWKVAVVVVDPAAVEMRCSSDLTRFACWKRRSMMMTSDEIEENRTDMDDRLVDCRERTC